MTCGSLGGTSLGVIDSFSVKGSGYSGVIAALRRHYASRRNEETGTPVDGDALVDPNHPGHLEAVRTVSHVDDDKHEETVQWLQGLLEQIEPQSDQKS
jgi:hypothetical protein